MPDAERRALRDGCGDRERRWALRAPRQRRPRTSALSDAPLLVRARPMRCPTRTEECRPRTLTPGRTRAAPAPPTRGLELDQLPEPLRWQPGRTRRPEAPDHGHVSPVPGQPSRDLPGRPRSASEVPGGTGRQFQLLLRARTARSAVPGASLRDRERRAVLGIAEPRPSAPKSSTPIASLAPGGDGVAIVEIDGERRAVFVPHAAPGRSRAARGRPLAPAGAGPRSPARFAGSDRVEPACPWSTRCGGCDWMHLSIAAQERAHIDHLRAALPARLARRSDRFDRVSATRSRTGRARGSTCRSRRGRRRSRGMHEARTNEPVEVETCAVLEPGARARAPGARGRSSGARRARRRADRPRREAVARARRSMERRARAGRLSGASRRPCGTARSRGAITSRAVTRPARIGDPTPWMAGADGETPAPRAGRLRASERADERRPGAARRVDRRGGAGHGQGGRALRRRRQPERAPRARGAPSSSCVESDREACDGGARQPRRARARTARVVEADAGAYAWSPGDPARRPRSAAHRRPRGGRASRSRPRYAMSSTSRAIAQTLGRDLGILAARVRADLGDDVRDVPADEPRRGRGRAASGDGHEDARRRPPPRGGRALRLPLRVRRLRALRCRRAARCCSLDYPASAPARRARGPTISSSARRSSLDEPSACRAPIRPR